MKYNIRLLIALFILFAFLIFMYAIFSQPLAIIGDVLHDAYPTGSDYNTGRAANNGLQILIPLALGAATVVGIIFLFIFYGMRNLGWGGGKNNFG